MIKWFCLLALFIGCTASFDLSNSKFLEYLKKFKKNRGLLEQAQRFKIWKDNMKKLEVLIEQAKGRSYELGENEFTDLTREEISRNMMSSNFSNFPPDFDEIPIYEEILENNGTNTRVARAVKASLDWRPQNIYWPVLKQGECGSCWAFAITASLELLVFRRYAKLQMLSQQHLVDCAGEGTSGCDGGWPHYALNFTAHFGNYPANNYPYTGKNGRCEKKTGTLQIVKAYQRIPTVEGMINYLNNFGPFVFHMTISNSFVAYKSGIYDPVRSECSSTSINQHAMSILGYGSENGKDYWIVRNSWGPYWGEGGYMRMIRGTNVCHCEEHAVGAIIR